MNSEQAGKEARADAITLTQELCAKHSLTGDMLVKELKKLVKAKSVKAQYDKDLQAWTYSDRLEDNSTRLRAIEISAKLLDLFPAERKELEHKGEIIIHRRMIGMDDGR